jgi:hypothetical protein
VLVVQLKRFAFSHAHRARLDTLVDFPVQGLDMQPYLAGFDPSAERGDGNMYDLFAVSEHMGGLGGGHYTAQVKSIADGVWYDCNDSSARPAGHDGRGAVTSSAYLLFYRKRRSEAYLPPVPRTADETAAEVERGMRERCAAAERAKKAKAAREAGDADGEDRDAAGSEPASAQRTGVTMLRSEYAAVVDAREQALAAAASQEELAPAGGGGRVGVGALLADGIAQSRTRSSAATAVSNRRRAIDEELQ